MATIKKVRMYNKAGDQVSPLVTVDSIIDASGNTVQLATEAQLEGKADKSQIKNMVTTAGATFTGPISGTSASFSAQITVPVLTAQSADNAAANKKYVDDAINGIKDIGLKYQIVDTLPAVDKAVEGVVYLKPLQENGDTNIYQQHILVSTKVTVDGTQTTVKKLELIGTTSSQVDISGKADLEGANTFSGANSFTGAVTVPEVTDSDSALVAVNKGYIDGKLENVVFIQDVE